MRIVIPAIGSRGDVQPFIALAPGLARAGIVHHGGYGTTAAGLRAGIPALVIPHVADQLYWGQHIHQLGVGLPFIPRAKLKREGLTSALKDLACSDRLRAAASSLGEKIRAENGVGNAVDLIEEVFG